MPETISRRNALVAASVAASAFLGRSIAAAHDADAIRSGAAPIYGHGLLVQLAVQDLDRSVRFYTDVLGFRVAEQRDDLQFVHLDCGVEGLQLGLSGGGSQPPAPGSVVLNFSVRGDVDAVRANLEKKGVRFAGPTQIIPGKVRLARFSDPDGYQLRLAGDDAPPQG